MLRMKTGKTSGVRRSTVSSASAGSSLWISAIPFWTCCSATTMLVAGSNCPEISAAPRMLRERTRLMPGTSMMACSIGRVTVSIIDCEGRVPLLTMATILGNCSGG